MRRAGRRLITLLCAGTMLFTIVALLVPALLGYQRYVITGGSMTGTFPKGSVIYSRLVPTEDLRRGDIITFVPPGMSSPVTHRIISVKRDDEGRPTFRTKGDFNEAADPWRVHLVEPRQARYVFHVPYLGYLLAALAQRQIRMLLLGVPAIVIALSLLVSLWRDAGRELERQEAVAAAQAAAPARSAATDDPWSPA